MKREGILFCLVGAAGSGKSTIGEDVVRSEKGSLTRSISVTSRKPRQGEINGKDYDFILPEEFRAMIDRKEFFEWEEIHGNLYGTRQSMMNLSIDEGRDLLFIIDIKGAMTMRKRFPRNTVITVVMPPQFDVLAERMKSRGVIGDEELQKRLATARDEYNQCKKAVEEGVVDFVIVNDDLSSGIVTFSSIVKSERVRGVRVKKEFMNQIFSTR